MEANQPGDALSFDRPTAAYIHIPFCRRRCFYCDFPISVVGDKPPRSRQVGQSDTGFGTIAEYVDLLCQEIHTTPVLSRSLATVFLGGGTPSLLTVSQLEQILETVDQRFGIDASAELSMEIDPDTVDLDRLRGYRAAGINRLSLGVQAFQPELLIACGRTHTPADIYAAVEAIHRVGVTNFSLDLISGLPHLTLDHWQDSLSQAIDLNPTHLSVYDLTVEPGTAFDRWYTPGADPLPSDEATAQMYRIAQKTLTQAGYHHYEISNYARSGYACQHNCIYWENRSYYGFGMAAASYTNGQRFTRPRKRREYYQWIQTLVKQNGTIDCPIVSQNERLLDTLMLGLRLAAGLSVPGLIAQFGEAIVSQVLDCLQPYQRQGWVVLEGEQSQRLHLTDPEGFLFSNVVLTSLFERFAAQDAELLA
ncbi:radical SAM family heme chaperone HemW [Egbenema bharatensis]|uniref:radical SAM family heme chaperone HemW n=1 Tax=Egbenema bharatensis TaxID=3463334 RepID=UPI003A8501EE